MVIADSATLQTTYCERKTIDASNPQQGSLDSSFTALSLNTKNIQREDISATNELNSKIPSTLKDPRKLFVGGLPADITNDEFHLFFSQFGEVLDSVVMFDRETKRSRGFGFVTYVDPAVCDHLLSFGGRPHDEEKVEGSNSQKSVVRTGRLEMRGKLIEIKEAEPKSGNGTNRRFGGSTSIPGQNNRYPLVGTENILYGNRNFQFDVNAYVWPQNNGAPYGVMYDPAAAAATSYGYETTFPEYMPPMLYFSPPPTNTMSSPVTIHHPMPSIMSTEYQHQQGMSSGYRAVPNAHYFYPPSLPGYCDNSSNSYPLVGNTVSSDNNVTTPVESTSVMQPVAPGIPPRTTDSVKDSE